MLLLPPPTFPSTYLIVLASVERYNPQENRWHTVSPMGTRRKHLGCAVYQDMIYSVGGRDDTTELSSAERYNPRTNQWSPVVAMTSRRSGVRTCRGSFTAGGDVSRGQGENCMPVFVGGLGGGKRSTDGSRRF